VAVCGFGKVVELTTAAFGGKSDETHIGFAPFFQLEWVET